MEHWLVGYKAAHNQDNPSEFFLLMGRTDLGGGGGWGGVPRGVGGGLTR